MLHLSSKVLFFSARGYLVSIHLDPKGTTIFTDENSVHREPLFSIYHYVLLDRW